MFLCAPWRGESCSYLKYVEYFDCFVLLPAFFTSHFLDEAV